MRLTAAFFANRAEVVNGLLNVDGGFWNSTTVAPDAVGFQTYTVVLCDVDPEDVGQPFSLIVDAQGPSGQRWTPAHVSIFTLASTIMFLYMPMMALPVEPVGGR